MNSQSSSKQNRKVAATAKVMMMEILPKELK